jgi:hypothetical protein
MNKTRDHRVDFLRGLALASIFINHIPGNLWEHFTHKNFGVSDAAEIFVMLAGFASAYAYFAVYQRGERFEASLKSWKRAGTLYICHVVTTVAAIAVLAAASLIFMRQGYLDDSIIYLNMKPIFADPVRSFIGLAATTHQLGYFNILPMYMVLLLMLPVMMWLAARHVGYLIAASVMLYLAAGYYTLDMPNYPNQGGWFFNPFAWQILFVTGLVLGIMVRQKKQIAYSGKLMVASGLYCLAAAAWVLFELWAWLPHLPDKYLWAHHLLYFDKSYVSLPRLLHVLALSYLVMMSPIGEWMKRIPASNMFTSMGRNSLAVFCWGSLLSMTAAVIRHEVGGGWAIDTVLVVTGLALLALLARALDWRKGALRSSGDFAYVSGTSIPKAAVHAPVNL